MSDKIDADNWDEDDINLAKQYGVYDEDLHGSKIKNINVDHY